MEVGANLVKQNIKFISKISIDGLKESITDTSLPKPEAGEKIDSDLKFPDSSYVEKAIIHSNKEE